MADEDQDGELFWDEDHFTFEKIKVSKERYYLFFKKSNTRTTGIIFFPVFNARFTGPS